MSLLIGQEVTLFDSTFRDMGIFALVLEAIDEEARHWYLKRDFGFETLLDDPNHLFLPVGTIRQLLTPLPALGEGQG